MKKLFFSFLVTATVTNCVLDIDLHINNLNDAQLKKVQELSEISKQIAEKHALLESWNQQIASLFNSDEEASSISEESLANFIQEFEKAFCEKKDVNGVLSAKFSASTEDYKFNFLKTFLIRRYFERLLVANLIQRYEKCLQELTEIDDNLGCL